jgi:uncharacterized protein
MVGIWIAGAAGIVSALTAGLWALGAKSQQPRRKPIEQEPDVPYEVLRFESGGVPMIGWLLKPAADDGRLLPAVVIAHGWGSNRSRVLRYARPLYDAGYAVFLYDARAHGESGHMKAPSGFMFRDDVEAAVDALSRQPGIDAARLAVLGHSIGGFGALHAYGRGLPIRALVTDATPLRWETMLRSELKKHKLPGFFGAILSAIWFKRAGIRKEELERTDAGAWLAANHSNEAKPLLMVHSLRDDVIPPDDLRMLTDRYPIRHIYVDTPGHSTSEQDPAFWDAVLPFLQQHLADR